MPQTLVSPDPIQLLQKWCRLWGVAELVPEISVEISTRMTRALGRCYPDRQLIRIASFVVEGSVELFQEVLCHEAAHLAAYQLHGRTIRPHGLEWKALMERAGYEPAVRFKSPALPRSAEVASPRRDFWSSLTDLLGVWPLEKARSLAFKRSGPKRPPDSGI